MRVMVIVKATHDSEAGAKPSQHLLQDMGAFNQKLIEALKGNPNRKAHYYCVMVYVRYADDPQPIIAEGAWVLPLTRSGMIEASTTRRPSIPRTRSVGSTTARSSTPMRHVPTGW